MMKNFSGIALLFFLVIVLGGLSALSYFQNGPAVQYNDTDPVRAAAYWDQQIENHGAEAAYAEFKIKNAQSPERGRHLSAHIIGEKIFQTEGVSGIRFCDASFSFGCYHGFFGQVFSRQGVESLTELDSVCIRAFGSLGTGCQHGIGHGILEYVGYQHIAKALELCEKTTRSAPLLGCVSGVFMEYNMPLVGISDALVPENRPFSEETADEPCRLINNSYKKSCYFEIGGWLESSLYNDDARVGTTCRTFSEEWRSLCFQGFGAMIPQREGYDVEKSKGVCDVFGGEDGLYCRAGVAWAMYSVPEYRAKTESACAYSDELLRARCMKLADLTEGKSGFPNL